MHALDFVDSFVPSLFVEVTSKGNAYSMSLFLLPKDSLTPLPHRLVCEIMYSFSERAEVSLVVISGSPSFVCLQFVFPYDF